MLLIGCDPEFIFRNKKGDLVPAYEVVSNSDFGLDGHDSTGELRPVPAQNSLALVANIRRLLKDGWEHDKISGLDMLSGHYKLGKAIGGHIHLSGFSFKFSILYEWLKITHLKLSDCIDPLDEREQRWGCGYGTGDNGGYRRADHGGIEFRVPGSWLLSPHIAFANLWMAEATAYAYAQNDFKAIETIQEKNSCEAIILFAEMRKDTPNQGVFLRVITKIFNNLPIDWDEPINRFWA